MRGKSEFFFLALLGLMLIVFSIYTQINWIDLSRHSLAEYWNTQIKTPAWREIVGAPFVAGLAFLIAAYIGFRRNFSGKAIVRFFIACEVFSAALILLTSYGILATVFCGLILIYVFLKYRNEL